MSSEQNNMRPGFGRGPGENIEEMYPDIYKRLFPYICDAVQRWGSTPLNEETLFRIIEDVIDRSGLDQDQETGHQTMAPMAQMNPADYEMNAEAAPVMARWGWRPGWRPGWGWRRNHLHDLGRILFLNRLFNW
jgi:hypothetical protein